MYPFLSQEKFAEYNVLDAVLNLLCLVNTIQIERLIHQIKASAGTMEQTDILEAEGDLFGGNGNGRAAEGGSITYVLSSPIENVSTVAEEGIKRRCYTSKKNTDIMI